MSSENITAEVSEVNTVSSPAPTNNTTQNTNVSNTTPQQFDPTKIVVTDENSALNGLVTFLNVAQRRGVFTFGESAKINECIQKFLRDGPSTTQ